MKVLSLFDGISCGQIALQKAGIDYDYYYACEIDKYAKAITQLRFPYTQQLGNVFDADFKALGDMDLVMGGFPCTGISIAKRDRETTLDGETGKLFHRLLDAIQETNAKYFLVENNASIHKDVRNAVSQLLGVEPIEINSSLVSAQQRKRLYWTNIPFAGMPQDKGVVMQDILESGIPYQDKAHCLTARYSGAVFWNSIIKSQRTMVAEPVRLGHIGKGGQGQRIYSIQGKSVNLTANGGGQGAKTGLYKVDLPDGDYLVRKLTPIEAERLQTLPDNYTKLGDMQDYKGFTPISDTQRYKAIGNGWTVDVIAHLLKPIKANQ
jgi:DNA (cytosine-5)-methyltransferase 3A